MKPAFATAAATAVDAPRYDPHYNHPNSLPHHTRDHPRYHQPSSPSSSSSSSSYPPMEQHQPRHHPSHHSAPAHRNEPSPPHHHYGPSSYPVDHPYPSQHHQHQRTHHDTYQQSRQREEQSQYAHNTHTSQEYHARQRREEYSARDENPYYPPSSTSGAPHFSARVNDDHRPYHYSQPYPSSDRSESVVRHTEGYEGRVRNTNRDHNDHLLTSDHHANTHDHHQHYDQYRRDPSGFLKHQPPSQYPSAQSSDRPPEDINKFHLPPIVAPEEPFYRKDLPGRHMRYFRNVTSQDREDRHGYYSSARHVAPSNTTGNFGHGPPIGDVLDRFGSKHAHQQQQHEQHEQRQHQQSEHASRLPSLYQALPDQRPSSSSNDSSPFLRSDSAMTPPDAASAAVSPQQQRVSYMRRSRSPVQSPAERPLGYGRQHHQHHQSPPYPQHANGLHSSKPKAIQPRSIAPAPMSSTSPISPAAASAQLSEAHPIAGKRSDRQVYIKMDPRDQPPHQLYQGQTLHPSSPPSPHQHAGGKRKWGREHSPARQSMHHPHASVSSAELKTDAVDETSQELHLLSRRGRYHHHPHHHHHQAQPPSSAGASVQSSSSPPSPSSLSKKSGGHPMMRMQRYQMTTIRCWHGAIAQKSYGIEKRYLCPPPMVQVSAGVNAKQVRAEQPHVTMSIIHEKINGHPTGNGNGNGGGENLMEQDCSLDDLLRCSFRNLHVTGTGSDSSKRFKLGLQVYLNKNSTLPTAIMDSNPIPIISKPSKKTAKAGNASCFILNGMSVSLLNRINAQTVRTKYMAVDNNAVCAKIGSWSSFTIKMVKPPPAPPVKVVPASMGVFKAPSHSTKFVPIRMKGDAPAAAAATGGAPPSSASMVNTLSGGQGRSDSDRGVAAGPNSPSLSNFQFRHQQQQQQHEPVYVFSNSEPVLYGSEIVLINDLTGIMTDRLIIRKVENGKVSRSGTGPVSQMQKIVLEHPERVHPEDGRAYYLSASSIGSPKIEGKIPLQAAMDRSPLLEYRTSSKKASIMDMTDAQEDEEDELLHEDEALYNGQTNSMPRRVSKVQDSVAVDDFVCWTIAGIAKFDYTYFGPIPASVDSDVDPSKVPAVLSGPKYNPRSNTMTMQVKNVFEKLTADEESRLNNIHQEDSYERKLTLSEYVYRRCEDVRQPMRDEEGPIQLWLAQHGPIRMRRRKLNEILSEEELAQVRDDEDSSSESDSDENEEVVGGGEDPSANNKNNSSRMEDRLPKIATKPANVNALPIKPAPLINAANGRYYGGSHLPASMNPALKNQKPRKMVKRPMGLEAELPYGCEVRAAHDGQGNARAELDLLMVERASGIAYRTGYKVVYSRDREQSDWIVEVVG
ncbi:hypothetical protein EC968_007096 [Mortierella alpina]|nr:hypothetical protein EC968_007096 [Mortierella alpina]